MNNNINIFVRFLLVLSFLSFVNVATVLTAQTKDLASITEKTYSQKNSASKKKDDSTTIKCNKCGGKGYVSERVSGSTKRTYNASSRPQICKDKNCYKHTPHSHTYQCVDCAGKGYIVKKK